MATTLINNTKRGYDVTKLSNQEAKFCLALLADLSYKPVNAARAAGYKNPSVMANKLMKRERVKSFLGKMQYEREQELKMDGRRILLEVGYCALRDAGDMVDENGIIVENINDLEPEVRKCIDGIKQKTFYDRDGNVERVETELRLVPKLGAIELAAKHFGLLLPDNHTHQHVHLNWDELASRTGKGDPVEEEIARVENATISRSKTNGQNGSK